MTGWTVPGSPDGSTSLSPKQQKQFSSWWLDENYAGDFNNVDGLYQNETTGAWQADPTKVFDINPETGQKGQFKYMATPAFHGWVDVTPDKFGYAGNLKDKDGNPIKVKMVRNRHGIYNPESAYGHDGNFSRQYQFTENPNTGEPGKWIFLGQMGWIDITPTPQKPQPVGSPTFDGGTLSQEEYDQQLEDYNNAISASGQSETPPANTPDNTSTDNTSTDTTTTTTAPTTSSGMMGGGNIGSSYSGGVTALAPLNVTPPPMLNTGGRVDYVRALNSSLATNVMRGMMTGAKR